MVIGQLPDVVLAIVTIVGIVYVAAAREDHAALSLLVAIPAAVVLVARRRRRRAHAVGRAARVCDRVMLTIVAAGASVTAWWLQPFVGSVNFGHDTCSNG